MPARPSRAWRNSALVVLAVRRMVRRSAASGCSTTVTSIGRSSSRSRAARPAPVVAGGRAASAARRPGGASAVRRRCVGPPRCRRGGTCVCWPRDGPAPRPASRRPGPGGGDGVGVGAAEVPPRAAGRRPGRRRSQGGRPRHPLDQEAVEAVRARPGHPDDRPHHARGGRHAGQGASDVRQGPPA